MTVLVIMGIWLTISGAAVIGAVLFWCPRQRGGRS